MIPFLRKKSSGGPETPDEAEKNESPPPPRPEEKPKGKTTTPGVQMLKEVWHIDTGKRKKEMAPPGVPTDIYCVPKQRQMPPRHGGS